VSQAFNERRKFGRRSVCKHAVAVLEDGRRVEGVVVDISEGGARIQVKDVTLLQSTFMIEIPDDDFVVKCEIVHYLENAVGLRFIQSPRRLSWSQRSKNISSISLRKAVDAT
jgi:PilZ domain